MQVNNRIIILFSILISISVNLQNIKAETLNETFKKQLNCTGKPFLEVKNSNGQIELGSWDKNEVLIVAYIRVEGKSDDGKKILERIEIEIEQDGDNIFVETILPSGLQNGGGFLSWLFGGKPWSVTVDYEITVPIESDLDLKTSNGSIMIEKVTGKFKLTSTNGKITAREVSGTIHSVTTNGKIMAEFNKIDYSEEMLFKTTNGSIRLYLPENFAGYADLKTTNGKIDSDFSLYDRHDKSGRSRKSFKGEIGEGDGFIKCKTTNGSIYLLK